MRRLARTRKTSPRSALDGREAWTEVHRETIAPWGERILHSAGRDGQEVLSEETYGGSSSIHGVMEEWTPEMEGWVDGARWVFQEEWGTDETDEADSHGPYQRINSSDPY